MDQKGRGCKIESGCFQGQSTLQLQTNPLLFAGLVPRQSSLSVVFRCREDPFYTLEHQNVPAERRYHGHNKVQPDAAPLKLFTRSFVVDTRPPPLSARGLPYCKTWKR